MTALVQKNLLSPFSIRLSKEQKERLSAIAKTQERSAHSVAVRALNQYIEQEEARLSFEKETHEAWQRYQTTGLHTTMDEVTQWMDTALTENEHAFPVCHK